MSTIRRITDDLEIVRLFPIIREDATAVNINWNEVDVKKLWCSLYGCMKHGAIFVAEKKGRIVGVNILTLVESFWGDKAVLHNLIYYVSPSHRKGLLGYKLLNEAAEHARMRGLPLEIKTHTFEDVERKDVLFERCGFRKIGHAYQLEE